MDNEVGIKLSLQQLSKDVSTLTQNMSILTENMGSVSKQVEAVKTQIEPLVEIYDGAQFARKFVVGLSVVIIAIGAIGAGFYALIGWIRHG